MSNTTPIFKVNHLVKLNGVSKIYVFYGDNFETANVEFNADPNNEKFAHIFNSAELNKIAKNRTEVVFCKNRIYLDDSIGTIKMKIIYELKVTFALEEMYMFCTRLEKLSPLIVYQSITQMETLELTDERLTQYFLNIKNVDGSSLNLTYEKKATYTYDDIFEMNIADSPYLIGTPIGQKFVVESDNYPYIANPFNVSRPDPFLYTLNKDLTTLNSNILLDVGTIHGNTINLCVINNVIEKIKNAKQFKYIVKIYYPFIYKDDVMTESDFFKNHSKYLEKTNDQILQKGVIDGFENVDRFYELRENSTVEFNYLYRGVRNIKFAIMPEFTLKIPIDIIFKILHTSKSVPLIQFNPVVKSKTRQQEKMYLLYTETTTNNGEKIPFLPQARVMAITRIINHTGSVLVYVTAGVDITILCEFVSTGVITVTIDKFPRVMGIEEIDNIIFTAINPMIELVKDYFDQNGYKIPIFEGINHKSTQIITMTGETTVKMNAAINISEIKPCIANVFISESGNNIKTEEIVLRFRRVSNLNIMDSKKAFIYDQLKLYTDKSDAVILAEMMEIYKDLTTSDARGLIDDVKSQMKLSKNAKGRKYIITDNPGFRINITADTGQSTVTFKIHNIDDVKYLHTLSIYIDSFIRMFETPNYKNQLVQICGKQIIKNDKLDDIVAVNDANDSVRYDIQLNQNENTARAPLTAAQRQIMFDDIFMDDDDDDGDDGNAKVGGADDSDNISLEQIGSSTDDIPIEISVVEQSASPDIEYAKVSLNSPSISPEVEIEAVKPENIDDERLQDVRGIMLHNKGTNYLHARMIRNDPILFENIEEFIGPDGTKHKQFDKSYSRMCQSNKHSQPISLTESEYKSIIADDPNAFDEDRDVIKYGSDPKKPNYYVCPKYWCLLTDKPLTEQQVNNGVCGGKNAIIIDDISKKHPLPQGKTILRINNPKAGERLYPGFNSNSLGTNGNKPCIPCCFTNAEQKALKNKITDMRARCANSQITQENPPENEDNVVQKTSTYIVAHDKYPLKNGQRGYLPIAVQKFMHESSNQCKININSNKQKPYYECLLRYGVENVEGQSFIGAIANCMYMGSDTGEPVPSINTMRNRIIDAVGDLDMFLTYQNGNLVTLFASENLDNIDVEPYKNTKLYSRLSETAKMQPTVQPAQMPDELSSSQPAESDSELAEDEMNMYGYAASNGNEMASLLPSPAVKEIEITPDLDAAEPEPFVEPAVVEPEPEPFVEPAVVEQAIESPAIGLEPVIESPAIELEPVLSSPAIELEPIIESPAIELEPIIENPSIELEPVSLSPEFELIEDDLNNDKMIGGDDDDDNTDDIELLDMTPPKSLEVDITNPSYMFFKRAISGYENFKAFLSNKTSIISHMHLWDIICRPNPNLIEHGINLIILRINQTDITHNVELVCPTNHYSSEFYDARKRTLFLILQDGIYEPIYATSTTGQTTHIIKTFSEYDPKLSKTMRAIFKKIIKPIINSMCNPLNSMIERYQFVRAPILEKLIPYVLKRNYKIHRQVMDYSGKIIGLFATDARLLTGFIPCYPSAINPTIDFVYFDDENLWQPYEITMRFLLNFYRISRTLEKNVMAIPDIYQIEEDEMIIGFLTKTNQFVKINPPKEKIRANLNITIISDTDYLLADIATTTSNKSDSERTNYIKKLHTEDKLFNVFRSTIRMLMNDYANLRQRTKIESMLDSTDKTYYDKMDYIVQILHILTEKHVVFANNFDYHTITNVGICYKRDPTKCAIKAPLCTTHDNICALTLPKKNLITGENNDSYYHIKIADELIRFNRIRAFVFSPQIFMAFDSVKYTLHKNEMLVLHSTLVPKWFEHLISAETNKYMLHNTRDVVNPLKTVDYKNTIIMDEAINPTVNENKCEKTHNDQITSAFWRKIFPSTYGEYVYGGTNACSYGAFIDIVLATKGRLLEINEVKSALFDAYVPIVQKHGNKVIDILIEQGKKTIGDQIKTQKMTLENMIHTDSYFLTNFDLWLLLDTFKITSVFISVKPNYETAYNDNIFCAHYDEGATACIFILTPGLRPEHIPSYKIIHTDTNKILIPFDSIINKMAVNESIKMRISIDEFLSKYKRDSRTFYRLKQKGVKENPLRRPGTPILDRTEAAKMQFPNKPPLKYVSTPTDGTPKSTPPIKLLQSTPIAVERAESTPIAVERAESSPIAVERAESSPIAVERAESSPMQEIAVERAESSPMQEIAVERAESSPMQEIAVERAESSPMQEIPVERAESSPMQEIAVERAESTPEIELLPPSPPTIQHPQPLPPPPPIKKTVKSKPPPPPTVIQLKPKPPPGQPPTVVQNRFKPGQTIIRAKDVNL